jgi:hypothetical protein
MKLIAWLQSREHDLGWIRARLNLSRRGPSVTIRPDIKRRRRKK